MDGLLVKRNENIYKINGFPLDHGITAVGFGDCSFQDEKEEERQNRRLLVLSSADQYFKIRAQHQEQVFEVGAGDQLGNYSSGDGLVYFAQNGRPAPLLIGNTADCPYVLLTDQDRSLAALIHSGRESTRLNIVGKAIRLIKNRGINPKDILAAIWPGICQYCYTLPEYYRDCFPMEYRNGYLNLRLKIWWQIILAEVPVGNVFFAGKEITDPHLCSSHTLNQNGYLFHSHRREKNGRRNSIFVAL